MRDFTQFQCSPGHILVEQPEKESKGLLIPNSEETRKGRVVAVGDSLVGQFNGLEQKSPCKVGDIIFHAHQYEGDVSLKGKKYKVIRFDGVLGIYGK